MNCRYGIFDLGYREDEVLEKLESARTPEEVAEIEDWIREIDKDSNGGDEPFNS